jgi:hypothetical protein
LEAWELHTVNGKHLPTDQSFAIEQRQHLRKHRGDRFARAADKVGDRGEVRLGVAGQGNEHDVVAAGALDRARAHHALRVRQQHRLEQHPRRICRCAVVIVAVVRVECGQIQLIDQMVHGMRE